jgi:hypothetical protein
MVFTPRAEMSGLLQYINLGKPLNRTLFKVRPVAMASLRKRRRPIKLITAPVPDFQRSIFLGLVRVSRQECLRRAAAVRAYVGCNNIDSGQRCNCQMGKQLSTSSEDTEPRPLNCAGHRECAPVRNCRTQGVHPTQQQPQHRWAIGEVAARKQNDHIAVKREGDPPRLSYCVPQTQGSADASMRSER